MSEAELKEQSVQQWHFSPRDFHIAFGCAVLALALHTYAQILELGQAAQLTILVSHTITYLFLLIELCLLVSTAGLWLRRSWALLVSVLSLGGVGFVYAIWYLYSRQILEQLSTKSFYQKYPEALPAHPLGLIGATWINFVVFVMSGILFIWEIKSLRAASRSALR
jgi:hypothetical protein